MNIQSTDIQITKLLLRETGTYNTQYSRPYETTVNGHTIAALQERYNGSGAVAPSLLAGIAYQFIQPMGQPERPINIINGWGNKRLQFLMEVQIRSAMGVGTTQVLMGYTDYTGLSLGMEIDPNMVFTINSTVSVRHNTDMAAFGNSNFTISGESNHILAANDWGGVFGNQQNEFRMRPTDVFSVMTRSHINTSENGGFLDTRNLNSAAPVKSRRTNGLAASFASSLLSNYSTAVDSGDMHMSQDEVLANARGNVAEGTVNQDPFLRAIANNRGATPSNFFTFADLTRLDPNVTSDQVTVVVIPNDSASKMNTGDYVHRAGDTADWGAATREAQFATIIGQSAPALLMSMGLMRLAFTVTNGTIDAHMDWQVGAIASFSAGMDVSGNIERFFKLLEINIMRDISRNGEVQYIVRCDMRLTSDSLIELSLDGGPMIPYNLPTFADALFTPIITQSDSRAVTLAGDFQKIFSNTIDAHGSRPDPVLQGDGIYGNI